MQEKYYANVFNDGQIVVEKFKIGGSIPIAEGHRRDLMEAVRKTCHLSENMIFFVPGISKNHEGAGRVLADFVGKFIKAMECVKSDGLRKAN